MFLSIGMLKQKYFLTDIFILSAEKQPIKLSWRKIEWLHLYVGKSATLLDYTFALHQLLDGAQKCTSANRAGNRRIVERCTTPLL